MAISVYLKGMTSALTLGLLLFVGDGTLAQNRRSAKPVSLAQMGCSSLNGIGRYVPINMDVTINRQVFRSVAYLHGREASFMSGRRGVVTDEPAGIACRLALPNERPRFRTLTLSFGFADNGYQLDQAGPLPTTASNISIYRDGKFYKSQSFRGGDAIRLPIDVSGVRSISIETECLQGGRSFTGLPGQTCPVLYFFEDILE